MYQDPKPPAESPGLRARREELRATQTRVGEHIPLGDSPFRVPGMPVTAADAADLRRASNAVQRQEAEQRRRAREVGEALTRKKG